MVGVNEKQTRQEHAVPLRQVMETLQKIGNPPAGVERARLMPQLLREIALHAQADRVLMFEVLGKEHFSQVFGYDALRGTDAVGSEVFSLELCALPQLQEMVNTKHSVLVPDVETLREHMPIDYEWMHSRGLKAVILFPTLYEGAVMGFVSLENPDFTCSQQLIDTLPLIGSYLGSVRLNCRRRDRLRQYRRLLKESSIDQHKQGFLDVFCRDYTSIYYVDLVRDTAEALKIADTSNTSNLTEMKEGQLVCYTDMVYQYANRYVRRENLENFLRFMDRQNVSRLLQSRERKIFRYRSYPNMAGHQYFEVKVVRFAEDVFDGTVFIGFRYIDDLVAAEQAQKEQLQLTVERLRASNEILTALGKIYYALFCIDLESDVYAEIASDSDIHHFTGRRGRANKEMQQVVSRFVAPEYRSRVQKFFDLTTLPDRLGSDETLAMEYLSTDGNWHTSRFIVQNRDANGRVTHVIYAARLISDIKRREKSWISIAKEANEANKAKTEFISQLAHDIRTPLNAIAGFTTLAQAHAAQPQLLYEDLARINSAEKVLGELVNNVLDLFRIEKGKMELHPEETDMRRFFVDLKESFDAEAMRKELTLTCSIHDMPQERLLADSLRLTQIYSNLLSNAVKYTDRGGTVELEAYEEPAAAPGRVRLIVAVKDTGIGISEEYKKSMYAMFTRETDTRINKVQGYGLGLSIVKQFTDMMGGKIEVESTQGAGSTFRVLLELPVAQSTVKPDAVPLQDRLAQDAQRCRGMRLLVAEDNDLNYEVVSAILAMYGVACERAEDGWVCVEKFKAQPGAYDAILMDMQMPVMNGLQAASILRSLDSPEAHSVPIIAMTANAFKDDVEACLNAGMNVHLAKPLDAAKLLHTLAQSRKR